MPPQPPPSLRDLITRTAADAKRLATAQVALAKAELSKTGERIGAGAALGIATAGIAFFAVMFLLLTLALVLVALGLPAWAGFLIVTALLLVGGAVTGLLAKRQFERARPPQLAMAELEKTRAALAGPEPAPATEP